MRSIGDGFTADQVWVFAERKTDTKGCGWDIGGRVDYLYGVDGPQTQSFGDHSFDFDWNTSSQYGFAMPQLYAEVAYNDVKVKIGHFYTPIGYEVVQARRTSFTRTLTRTPSASLSPTPALWLPTNAMRKPRGTAAGSMAGTKVSRTGTTARCSWEVSLQTSPKRRRSPGTCRPESWATAMRFPAPPRATCTTTASSSPTNSRRSGRTPSSTILAHNYNVNPRTGVDNQWYEVDNYLSYKINDCWSFGGRAEWFQDPQGARVSAGSRGNYFAVTGGLNYKPHANLTIRPELRYDWFDGFAGTTVQPFNNGTASTQLSGGFDVIFTF